MDGERQETMSERVNRDRPAKNPGGMQCERCDEIFIGEAWGMRSARFAFSKSPARSPSRKASRLANPHPHRAANQERDDGGHGKHRGL
jgi:hypothetical protein